MKYDVIYFQGEYHVFVKNERDRQWVWWGSFGDSKERAEKTAEALNGAV
jgi:hypothetical protein